MSKQSPKKRRAIPSRFETESKEIVRLPPISSNYSRGIPLSSLEKDRQSSMKHSVSQPTTKKYKRAFIEEELGRAIRNVNKTEQLIKLQDNSVQLSARNPETVENEGLQNKKTNKSQVHLKPIKGVSLDQNKNDKSKISNPSSIKQQKKSHKKSNPSSSMILTNKSSSKTGQSYIQITPKFVNLKCIDYIPQMKSKLQAKSKDLSKPIIKKSKEINAIQTIPVQRSGKQDEKKTILQKEKFLRQEPTLAKQVPLYRKPIIENKPKLLFNEDTEINKYISSIKQKVRLLNEQNQELE